MVEVEAVTGKITIDASGAVQGYQQAGQAAQQFGEEAQTTSETVDGANTQIANSQDKVTTSTNATGAATVKTSSSFKDAVTSSSALALSGLSLYNSYDQIEKAQLRLDKANKTSEASQITLTKAQGDYNTAVEKYGVDSQQAKDAADKLKVAQDAYDNSIQTVKLDQDHLNEVTAQTAITFLPAVITGIDGAVKAYKTLKDLDMGGALGKITNALGENKGALISMGAAAGAAFVVYEAFTTQDPALRAELSLLAGVLIAAATAQWILNAAEAMGITLSTMGAGAVIVGVALASAAAVYAASSMYGAGTSGSGSSGESSAASASSSGSSSGSSSSGGSSGLNSVAAVESSFNVTKTAENVWKQKNGSPISSDEANWFEGRGYTFDNSSQSWTKGGGNNVTINVNGAQDADITANAVANKLKNAGM